MFLHVCVCVCVCAGREIVPHLAARAAFPEGSRECHGGSAGEIAAIASALEAEPTAVEKYGRGNRQVAIVDTAVDIWLADDGRAARNGCDAQE